MDQIIDLLKILLPAGIVLYAMFLVVKAFINKEYSNKIIETKTEYSKIILPIRLQAYERICLFLERIAMNNLILRVNNPSYNAAELHQILLHEIRSEFNHNLSQQMYMSNNTWNAVQNAMEESMALINQSAREINAGDKGIELAKKILIRMNIQTQNSVSIALSILKAEIRTLFI